jgi:signal transduction histidine kinase/ActR/RegA family two-component response regulator
MPFVYFVVMMFIAKNSENGVCRAIELQHQNLDLVGRLREETHIAVTAKKEADAARHDAEQANIDKSKFLAAASHDLRQPLHAMGLFVEALARSELTPVQHEVLGHARAASAATNEMLMTLLDFSRLEAGVVLSNPKVFLLQDMLSRLEQEFGLIADEKNLFFRLRDTTAAAYADPALVDLILRNLISNALRYTESGGILLAARNRGQFVTVEVWDTGIGIAQDQQVEIFREFHQLGNSERDRRKGLGLGLAIVQKLAHTMGVRVELNSRLGHGSVFRVWLPRFTGVIEPVETVLDLQPAPLLEKELRGLRIMVIDDEEPVRIGMQKLLDSWHCTAQNAECLEDAIALLDKLPPEQLPQILISDYRLRNNVTGAHVLTALRLYLTKRDCPHAVRAIIITGDTAPERLREAQKQDAVLLHKPVSADTLFAALQTSLR